MPERKFDEIIYFRKKENLPAKNYYFSLDLGVFVNISSVFNNPDLR
ncbi:MAG: hypothetical protein N2201_00870 [candidate division WOR-3 bacterium]|nr:hypothetical protein [candidate division WOR-3 bacterium]